jgi:hypothetical protein
MNVRRVVTGKVGGKSKVISEGGTRRSRAFNNIPGQSAALLWSTSAIPSAPTDGTDVVSEATSYVPTQPVRSDPLGWRDNGERKGNDRRGDKGGKCSGAAYRETKASTLK